MYLRSKVKPANHKKRLCPRIAKPQSVTFAEGTVRKSNKEAKNIQKENKSLSNVLPGHTFIKANRGSQSASNHVLSPSLAIDNLPLKSNSVFHEIGISYNKLSSRTAK